MPVVDYPGSAPAPRKRTSWLAWVAAVFVLIVAFGYFVVKPVAERIVARTMQGAGMLLGSIFGGIAAVMQKLFDDACRRVEQSDEVKAMLGDNLVCAPIEETQWLEPPDDKHLEFKFKITGPLADGEVHVVAAPRETDFEITRLVVTGPGGEVVEVPPAP